MILKVGFLSLFNNLKVTLLVFGFDHLKASVPSLICLYQNYVYKILSFLLNVNVHFRFYFLCDFFFGYFLGIFGFVGCVMRSCWTVVLSHSLMLTAQSVEGQSERDLKDFFFKITLKFKQFR